MARIKPRVKLSLQMKAVSSATTHHKVGDDVTPAAMLANTGTLFARVSAYHGNMSTSPGYLERQEPV